MKYIKKNSREAEKKAEVATVTEKKEKLRMRERESRADFL